MKYNSHTIAEIIFIMIIVVGCSEKTINAPTEPEQPFTVTTDHILRDDEVFPVRGVVYVPGYPGYLPWEIETSNEVPEQLENSVRADLEGIRALGANTVRFWGAPKACYEILKEIGSLSFVQTIWIDTEAPDFQDESFKSQTREYIRTVIDRIHGVYSETPPLLGYLVGNELSESSIRNTDQVHPDMTQYRGSYIQTDSSRSATESFIAEMADYVIEYSIVAYNYRPLVSYTNDIRTFDDLRTPFLDFQSQNAYSYAVPYYRPGQTPGSKTGTLFQGWVETLKAAFPEQPLVITETGLSVSPEAPHIGPPNYGYGGNTEQEQSNGILQNLNDIETAQQPVAGAIIHEYLDAWWKSGLEDSYVHEPEDIEEWFGLVALEPSSDWYVTIPRQAYYAVQSKWTGN